MSGGEIDYYRVSDIADNPRLKDACPELADMMRDLGDVLYKMDYFICGDIAKGPAYTVWRTFCNKWSRKLKKYAEIPKMKPCALCGAIGEHRSQIVSEGWQHDEIVCTNCGMKVTGSDYETVVEKWNKRAEND